MTIFVDLCQPCVSGVADVVLESGRRRVNRITARLFPVGSGRDGDYESLADTDAGAPGEEGHANPPEAFPHACRVALGNLIPHSTALPGTAAAEGDEKILMYTRPIFARRVVEDLFASLLGVGAIWLVMWTVFGLTSGVSRAFAWALSCVLVALLSARLYYEYRGLRWVVVTSDRIVLVDPRVLSGGDVSLTSVYTPNFPRVEKYPDGSGEIRFYQSYAEWNEDRAAAGAQVSLAAGSLASAAYAGVRGAGIAGGGGGNGNGNGIGSSSSASSVDDDLITGGSRPSVPLISRLSHMPNVMALYKAIAGPDSNLEMTSSLLDADPSDIEMGNMGGGGGGGARPRVGSAADERAQRHEQQMARGPTVDEHGLPIGSAVGALNDSENFLDSNA